MAQYVTFSDTGDNGESLAITDYPSEIEAGTTGQINFELVIGELATGTDLEADVTLQLYVGGVQQIIIDNTTSSQTSGLSGEDISGADSPTAQRSDTRDENTTLEGSFDYTFQPVEVGEGEGDPTEQGYGPGEDPGDAYPSTVRPIYLFAQIDYEDGTTVTMDTLSNSSTQWREVSVTAPRDTPEVEAFGSRVEPDPGPNPLESTFEGYPNFVITDIKYEEDASYVQSEYTEEDIDGEVSDNIEDNRYIISFGDDFGMPSIAKDGAGRFAKHEIIGGMTVRQKIGEDPLNVSVSGVCTSVTANKIDSLRDAKTGVLQSPRMPGRDDSSGSLRVQFGSTSTEPLEDGGAANMYGDTAGQLLYSYTINAIEVIE